MLEPILEKRRKDDFLPTAAIFGLLGGYTLKDYSEGILSNTVYEMRRALAKHKHADTTRLAFVMQSLGWRKARKNEARGYRKGLE